jgi:hypothetical protein
MKKHYLAEIKNGYKKKKIKETTWFQNLWLGHFRAT